MCLDVPKCLYVSVHIYIHTFIYTYIYVVGFTPIQHWQQLPECSPCPQGPRMLMSTPNLRDDIVLSQRSDNH